MLPWREMLRAALAAGLPPEAFWRLSLREWRALMQAGGAPPRQILEDMMAAFPDQQETQI